MKIDIDRYRLANLIIRLVLLCSLMAEASAFAQAPFYQGKTITLVRGSTPGGIGETRVRALVQYLKKHIPGEPAILIEFMDGGGGRKAANHVYTRSDGLTIGSTPGGILASAILGEPASCTICKNLFFLGQRRARATIAFSAVARPVGTL